MLMGGYAVLGLLITQNDQYFDREYNNLGPHNQISLTYLLYPLDSWVNLLFKIILLIIESIYYILIFNWS